MNFNDVRQSVNEAESSKVKIPEKWGQGRATFGGLVAAVMYEKIAPVVSEGKKVRSIMVSFVAPVAPGELDIMVSLLREGKSATQVQATAYQNDHVCAVLLASFGDDRESSVNVKPELGPVMTSPEKLQAFPFIPNLTPDFTQYFDYRYALGKMPFMGSEQTDMGGWIKLRELSEKRVTVTEILALLDAWPPAIFSMLKKPASGSSLTWTINFVNIPDDCTSNDWWQYKANVESSANGYSHIDATLWDNNGKVVVNSRQTVSVFA
jgi:acyl-CoA thioesterase